MAIDPRIWNIVPLAACAASLLACQPGSSIPLDESGTTDSETTGDGDGDGDGDGRMKPSSFRERVVDVLEELFRVTLLLRDRVPTSSTRYSEQEQLREQGQLSKGLGVS